MKYAFVGVCAMSLAASAQAGLKDKLPLDAYRNPIDRQIAATGKGVPGKPYPCTYEEFIGGTKGIVSQPTEICVKMLPQQHWRGLWRNDFEGSRFCPAPAKRCTFETPGERIWLSRAPGRADGGLYRVDFIGRRTMYKGPYGHMGVFDEELFIDKPIKIELIEEPRSRR
jgi:hypothetical protein